MPPPFEVRLPRRLTLNSAVAALFYLVLTSPICRALVKSGFTNEILLCATGSAVSFAMVTHWVCNFAIGQLFLPATAQFGVSTVYLGFAGVCILAAIFVQAAVLETKVTHIPILLRGLRHRTSRTWYVGST